MTGGNIEIRNEPTKINIVAEQIDLEASSINLVGQEETLNFWSWRDKLEERIGWLERKIKHLEYKILEPQIITIQRWWRNIYWLKIIMPKAKEHFYDMAFEELRC